MELAVVNPEGKKTSKKVKLNKSVFGIEPNDHAIYLDVKLHLANQRQGNAKTKERGEIAGSTRKIKKQKGTGTARAGSIKSPLFRGGGTIFGPRPRSYSFKVNKKVKQLARRSALSFKAKNDGIIVLQDLNYDSIKTKQYAELLKNLEVANQKTVIVLGEKNDNVYASAKNIKSAKVITADALNTYDILNNKKLILMEGSIEKIEKSLS